MKSTDFKEAPVCICTLYRFVTLADYQKLQVRIQQQLQELTIKGTLLLAQEGINGTIAGSKHNVLQFLAWLQTDTRFTDIDYKLSYHQKEPFYRTKVKLKKEIVTMGVDGIDPNQEVGTYVEPEQWNALLEDPETLVIDTRNDYEYEIGTFKNALNPDTQTFREFPNYVDQYTDPLKHKKVAMFCTGGIRCEKASAFMKKKGFEQVYHLKGGVLRYLEKMPAESSLWQGECFVFDDRVAVNHQLEKGKYEQCHACRYPLTQKDKQLTDYEPGVSCHRCITRSSKKQKSRFAQREKQMQLAKEKGISHIGDDARATAHENKQNKLNIKAQQRSS